MDGRCSPSNCIICHSSIQPTATDLAAARGTAVNPGEQGRQEELNSAAAGQFWDHDPGRLADQARLHQMGRSRGREAGVLEQQLSLDRHRVRDQSTCGTNACRAMATNAMNGHMWQDFASDSYRSMPSVGGDPVLQSLSR